MLTALGNTGNMETVSDYNYTYVQPCWTCNCTPCICNQYTYYPQPYYNYITYPSYPDMSGIEKKLDKIIRLLDPDNKLDEVEEVEKEAWEKAVKFLVKKFKGRYKELLHDLEKEFG